MVLLLSLAKMSVQQRESESSGNQHGSIEEDLGVHVLHHVQLETARLQSQHERKRSAI